jgi:uncharacterized protein YdbL (DUF1318 family)
MKLKLGLLLTALVVAQAPVQAGLFSETTKPAQQLDIVSKNVQDYLAAQRVGAGAKAAPAGLNDDQKAKYKEVEDNISKIAATVDTKIIPLVENAVKSGSFSFIAGGKLLVQDGPGLLATAMATVDAIKALNKTSPSARLVIKNNLENTYKVAQLDKLVARLTKAVSNLSDSGTTGAIKSVLLLILPKLNDIPKLIASQL